MAHPERLTHCPHCQHTGNGLTYAYNDDDLTRMQAVCLACGVHGPFKPAYAEAADAFLAGETEDA